jgi:hypothetical protein
MRCHLSLSIAARRAEKRVPPRNTIDRSAAGTSGRHPIGRLRHRIEESRRGKILSMGVSNFAQTADARSGNF